MKVKAVVYLVEHTAAGAAPALRNAVLGAMPFGTSIRSVPAPGAYVAAFVVTPPAGVDRLDPFAVKVALQKPFYGSLVEVEEIAK